MTNTIIELTRFRADLTRALARRGKRLLEAADPAGAVAALEPLEAYFIVRELGLDQARPLLLHLNQEQLQACVDLTCWQRYDFQLAALAEWLGALVEEGPEAVAKTFLTLDSEVQVLFLARTLTIYSFADDDIPEDDDEEGEVVRAMTPDSRYLLEMRGDEPLPVNPLGLVGALYQYDAEAAERLVTAVRWEMPSQVEEEALRLRGGRMHELGFVAADEAAVLFSRPSSLPPSRSLEPVAGAVTRLPALYAQLLGESNLLVRALALLSDSACLGRLEQELVWTINTAVIAYGDSPRDIEYVADIAMRVRDTISLGLHSLLAQEKAPVADGDEASRALALLQAWSMRDLFRQGYAAALPLRVAAKQALELPQVKAWHELPEMERSDEPEDRLDRAFVGALLGRHPLVGGFAPDQVERVRAFASLAQIDAARKRLEAIVRRLSASLD